ncbi:MAG TPA: tRNA 2-thiouridine(34) synthase MnmA [Clostridiales bacterium]|nr:tRNA 2-thiouridine(34) synthase MnmA [Clostridiales bacterium]
MDKKAIIAMSGGVDSSVAAFLMKEQGYDCMGVTIKMFDNENIVVCREKSCCSLEDVEDARSVAKKLEIPYHVFNFTANFKDTVINRFISAYENGATPNPCIDCNRYIKFDKLYRRAKELDYDYVVTGHYAQIEYDEINGRFLLKKGLDTTKDQSYVLYSMTQDQLAHTIFPLGNLKKSEVRIIAEQNGFINALKQDSQDICFVTDGDYARFIENYTGKNYSEGNFVDTQGKILGKHNGIIRYTVGQRKGLGLSLSKPMFVCSINNENNTVVLCEDKELFSKSLDAIDFNWIAYEKIEKPIRVQVKIRYKHAEQFATVTQTSNDIVHIEFDEPQRAITKGQAVVLYDGDIVVGGGTII